MMRPARGVGVVDDEVCVYVASLPDGPILVLDGPSALAWRTACTRGADAVSQVVAEATGEDAGTIAPYLERFLSDLVDRGLLVRAAE
ncbi:hypothetical protein [Microbacterium istanbulense]|uniref:Coenzyme PQQ synthesis protein D (PqqD) n=1 Tax=Microbacterium istanbulense TaxID=3122049 RepID=A0ABU8LJ59_9MICO